jgi:hypothetical protein
MMRPKPHSQNQGWLHPGYNAQAAEQYRHRHRFEREPRKIRTFGDK